MITYTKIAWGFPLLFRCYGSAIPRAIPLALISAVITWALSTYKREAMESYWRHPYPYQVFSYIVAFIVVFRSNWGYQRYWEGRSSLQLMSSRWSEAALEILMFDRHTLPNGWEKIASVASAADQFRDTALHLMSLLHAVALQSLRQDWELSNLVPHDSQHPAPPSDVRSLRQRRHGCCCQGWLNPMVGQFSWVDVFMLRTGPKFRQKFNEQMPLPVIGGISTGEAESLGAEFVRLVTPYSPAGTTVHDGQYIAGPAERVAVVMAWVFQLLLARVREGGLAVPAPILTRVYQLLADGMLGFDQCRKLVDTPFPFPWSQMVLLFLIGQTLLLPFMITGYIRTTWLAVMVDIAAIHTHWALNEVARDLEDPFEHDPNELPLPLYQFMHNKFLLAVSRTERPFGMTDVQKLDMAGDISDTPTAAARHSSVFDSQTRLSKESPFCYVELSEPAQPANPYVKLYTSGRLPSLPSDRRQSLPDKRNSLPDSNASADTGVAAHVGMQRRMSPSRATASSESRSCNLPSDAVVVDLSRFASAKITNE